MPHDEPYFRKYTSLQIKERTKLAFIQIEIKPFTFKSFTNALLKTESFLSFMSKNIMRFHILIFFIYLRKLDNKLLENIAGRNFQRSFSSFFSPKQHQLLRRHSWLTLSQSWMLPKAGCSQDQQTRKSVLILHCSYSCTTFSIYLSYRSVPTVVSPSDLPDTLLAAAFQLKFEQCRVSRRIIGCILQAMLCLCIAAWYLLCL